MKILKGHVTDYPGTRAPNLKSVVLTVLELLRLLLRCSQTHSQTDRQTDRQTDIERKHYLIPSGVARGRTAPGGNHEGATKRAAKWGS